MGSEEPGVGVEASVRPCRFSGSRTRGRGDSASGGQELPSLHLEDSTVRPERLPHCRDCPPRPRHGPTLKDFGGHMSKPMSAGNTCSQALLSQVSPAAEPRYMGTSRKFLHIKFHCAFVGLKPRFSPKQPRLNFFPVSIPEAGESCGPFGVDHFLRSGHAHVHRQSQEPLQTPSISLHPAEAVPEESGRLHSSFCPDVSSSPPQNLRPAVRSRDTEKRSEGSWGRWWGGAVSKSLSAGFGSKGSAPAHAGTWCPRAAGPFRGPHAGQGSAQHALPGVTCGLPRGSPCVSPPRPEGLCVHEAPC